MAVMVTLTLNLDAETYQSIHPHMLPLAQSEGLLFHSAREVGDRVAVVDFWPSAEAFRRFADGPMAAGMKAAGITPPDDVEITPVLTADAG
jgi:heme-degrading monooxygenase HmoA